MFGEVSDNVVVRWLNQNLKKRLYFKFLNWSSQVCTESLHQVLLAVSEANQEITAKFSEELVEILE
jgi:hypothetical protein